MRIVSVGRLRLLLLLSLLVISLKSTCRGQERGVVYDEQDLDHLEDEIADIDDYDDEDDEYLMYDDEVIEDDDVLDYDEEDIYEETVVVGSSSSRHHTRAARGSSGNGAASSSTTTSNSNMDFPSLDEDWEVTLQEDMQGNYHLLFERETATGGGRVTRSVPLDEEFNQLSEEEIIQLAIDFFDQHMDDALWDDDEDYEEFEDDEEGDDYDEDEMDETVESGKSGNERRQRERTALSVFFTEINGTAIMKEHGGWLSSDGSISVCEWSGIRCGPLPDDDSLSSKYPSASQFVSSTHYRTHKRQPPDDAVTAIELPQMGLNGTLPTQLSMLEYLTKLQLENNEIYGTIPSSLAYLSRLRQLDLSDNNLSGPIPSLLSVKGRDLKEMSLARNRLTGTFPKDLRAWRKMGLIDVSDNFITGTIPKQLGLLTNLVIFNVADNMFTGSFPTTMGQLNDLRVINAAGNSLWGTLPHAEDMSKFPLLTDLDVSDNDLTGTFPPELLLLENLHTLALSDNLLQGPLPRDIKVDGERAGGWSTMSSLRLLHLSTNDFTGTIPPQFFNGLRKKLGSLDLSYNNFSGTIATQLGQMTALHTINAMGNQLAGSLPTEMLRMNPNLRLNFTDNRITGKIPGMFCGEGASQLSLLYREFGCDAVLCRAGTFNVHGHATLHSACRPCPKIPRGQEKVLGRVRCEGLESSPQYVHGDLDGDGILSHREILRMIYIDNIGRFWGPSFQTWADISVSSCDLTGIMCLKGRVAKIDLSDANMCSNGDRQRGPIQFCLGLPSEIGQLLSLEVFQANRRQFLRGTIPTEFGRLSRLQVLDLSSCPSMSGTVPTELEQLPQLRYLLLSHSPFHGPIPSGLFQQTMLEKLSLTNNKFTGSLPPTMNAIALKELMISRNELTGTIPTQIGQLAKLENFEGYGNHYTGTIPTEIATCSNLKRMDMFNNALTGPLPKELGQIQKLQILHLKENKITGTIPSEFGDLPSLTWFDVSNNRMHGTIPQSFATSASIKDFRIANNMIYGPIPSEMCANKNINGGPSTTTATKDGAGRGSSASSSSHDHCNAVACALGSFSTMGHAVDSEGGCTKCPQGESTLYLGSTKCVKITTADILSIFMDVMDGENLWPPSYVETWGRGGEEEDGDNGTGEQGKRNDNVCDWEGVRCDEDGQVISLSFPLIGSDGSYLTG